MDGDPEARQFRAARLMVSFAHVTQQTWCGWRTCFRGGPDSYIPPHRRHSLRTLHHRCCSGRSPLPRPVLRTPPLSACRHPSPPPRILAERRPARRRRRRAARSNDVSLEAPSPQHSPRARMRQPADTRQSWSIAENQGQLPAADQDRTEACLSAPRARSLRGAGFETSRTSYANFVLRRVPGDVGL